MRKHLKPDLAARSIQWYPERQARTLALWQRAHRHKAQGLTYEEDAVRRADVAAGSGRAGRMDAPSEVSGPWRLLSAVRTSPWLVLCVS